MPFAPKAALLHNASRGNVVRVQQRLDANHPGALQRPAREKNHCSCRESVALRVGRDPIADARNLSMGAKDKLAVTETLGDAHLQPWSPDKPDVPSGRMSDRRDCAGNPNAQGTGLLSTDPRHRRVLGVAPRRANRSDVIVLPSAQFEYSIAQDPGIQHVGHAHLG